MRELRGERLEGGLVGGLVAGKQRRLGGAGAALAEVGPQLPEGCQLRVDLVLELTSLYKEMQRVYGSTRNPTVSM